MIPDALEPLAPGAVSLGGFLGKRLNDCATNRIKAQVLNDLIQPFIACNDGDGWQCEFWGKWFTSATQAWRYYRTTEFGTLCSTAVQKLLATQRPDGYIGTQQSGANFKAAWDIWGRKYTLLGLLSYYDLTGDTNVLSCAKRHADNLLTYVGPGKANLVTLGWFRGMPPSSILEPMVLLYNCTKDRRYLDFGKDVITQWHETADGPDLVNLALKRSPVAERFPHWSNIWSWSNGIKAYEMMSCHEGLLEMYRATGIADYRTAVINTFKDIRDNEIGVTGSASRTEMWHTGAKHQTENIERPNETCVTVTWMKLCYQLLRLTGESTYADQIERTAYNALLGAFNVNAEWTTQYNPIYGLSRRSRAEYQTNIKQNCCVANAPRGLMLLPAIATMMSNSGPVINLYWQGEAVGVLSSGTKVRVIQSTDYPIHDTAAISVMPDRSEQFTLRLRIPAWSTSTTVTVNGTAVAGVVSGMYTSITRVWSAGDHVNVKFDFQGRLFRDPAGSEQYAILRGPIVICSDNRLGLSTGYSIRKDGPNIQLSEPDTSNGNFWFTVQAPFLQTGGTVRKAFTLCDYASAGNNFSDEYTVWTK